MPLEYFKPRGIAVRFAEKRRGQSLDPFTKSYIKTALWSSTDNTDESGGEPIDKDYTPENLDPDTLLKMVTDCHQFQEQNRENLELVSSICDDEKAGHSFWLNRNGHGAGFWSEYPKDPQLEKAFEELSEASKAFGSFDLYPGEDNAVLYGYPL